MHVSLVQPHGFIAGLRVTASAAARPVPQFLSDVGHYNAVRKRLFLRRIAMLPRVSEASAQLTESGRFHDIEGCARPVPPRGPRAAQSPSPERSNAPWFHRCADGYE
jgi:hypothetical protein